MMEIDLDTLNANQRSAVSWNDGPLLVLAGPGSGKTLVLTSRVVRILEEGDDTSVLALTFTTKAAAEMRARVDRLLGRRAERVRLCTFHSFAVDLLRQHGSHLSLRPDFSLITQIEDRIAMVDEAAACLQNEGEAVPEDRRNLLTLVDRLLADSCDGGAAAPSLVDTPPWVPRLFARYCQTLVTANRLDFGSLLHFARRLLAEKPGVARVVRLGWTHLCVDEFQDTNRAQYDLLRLIAPDRRARLFVVGDEDQIIYQWNGANPERLAQLRRDYDMHVVQLPECYRCPASIIALANRLIVHNARRFPNKTPLRASHAGEHGDANGVRCEAFASPDEEAAFIPKDICDRGLAGSECVVLGRTAKLLGRAASALADAGLEACVTQRKTDFESPAIGVLTEALRLANARHDREVLRRLCLAWERLAGESLELDAVTASAALVGGDYLRAWADAASVAASPRTEAVVERIRTDLLDSIAFPAVVDWFLQQGWRSWAGDEDELLAEELKTWRELHDDLVREHGSGRLTLNVYLQQMDMISKAPRPEHDAVRCMTVHGSKGLGSRHVYLIGMAQEIFPSFQALRKGPRSRELEEERRNCFVAVTRVERTLTLTRAQHYHGYRKAPSQFLGEMGLVGQPPC